MSGVPEEKSKLGVVASAFSPDARTAPTLARKAGFDGLLFQARSDPLDIAELSMSGRREFARMLSAQNQQLVGLRHDLGPKGFAPGAAVDRELSWLERVLEAAAGLGAPLVCLDVGPLPVPLPSEPSKPAVTPDMAGLILLPTLPRAGAYTRIAAAAQPPDPAMVSQV